MYQKIVLQNIDKPKEAELNDDVDWLCETFGFTPGRDVDKVSSKIIHTILKEIAEYGYASTTNIANDLNMAIQRVNYHLRSLIDSGFIHRQNKQILIREGSVKAAIEEMRRDANRIFDNLSEIGEEIDNSLGFRNR